MRINKTIIFTIMIIIFCGCEKIKVQTIENNVIEISEESVKLKIAHTILRHNVIEGTDGIGGSNVASSKTNDSLQSILIEVNKLVPSGKKYYLVNSSYWDILDLKNKGFNFVFCFDDRFRNNAISCIFSK